MVIDVLYFFLETQENKNNKKIILNDNVVNLQQNTHKSNLIKKQAKKPTSLNSVPNKSMQNEKSNEFIIPELPEGRLLEIKIFTNWGDKYLVGLNGIELFDSNGEKVLIEKVSTTGFYSNNRLKYTAWSAIDTKYLYESIQ